LIPLIEPGQQSREHCNSQEGRSLVLNVSD
jgi:hypothetical protein